MVRLQPKNDVMNPNVNELIIEPMVEIDPIHDTWSFVRGPVINGVSRDKRIGVAGAYQPTMQPWLKNTKLANKNKSHIQNEKKKTIEVIEISFTCNSWYILIPLIRNI